MHELRQSYDCIIFMLRIHGKNDLYRWAGLTWVWVSVSSTDARPGQCLPGCGFLSSYHAWQTIIEARQALLFAITPLGRVDHIGRMGHEVGIGGWLVAGSVGWRGRGRDRGRVGGRKGWQWWRDGARWNFTGGVLSKGRRAAIHGVGGPVGLSQCELRHLCGKLAGRASFWSLGWFGRQWLQLDGVSVSR